LFEGVILTPAGLHAECGENRENSICSGYLPAVDWIDQAIPKLTGPADEI